MSLKLCKRNHPSLSGMPLIPVPIQGVEMSLKTLEMAIFDIKKRTTRTEFESSVAGWIYFHSRSKIFLWPSQESGRSPAPLSPRIPYCCQIQRQNQTKKLEIKHTKDKISIRRQIIQIAQLLFPAAGSRHGGLYVRLLFLIFNDSCQTNYLKMYRTDLRQVLKADRTMHVDDQSKISFQITQGTLP